MDAYNPDVVVYLARGETFDQEVGGQWQNIGQPGFDSYLVNRYRQAVSVLGSKGASVVLLTTPYYDSGTSPAGTPWPEDAPARVTLDNATMRQVATTTPPGADGSRVYVFDLNAVVSPDHAFSPTVDQINVRCTDGVHFTRSGGIYVGLRLAPELAALGPGPCHGVAGWRVAGTSATIDPVMVLEPALPVVRRATADDVTAMAAQLARTFSTTPSRPTSSATRPAAKPALRAYFRTQMQADYLPFGGCYTTEGYAGSAIWAPAGQAAAHGPGGHPHHAARAALRGRPTCARRCACWRWSRSKHPREPHWYLASLGTAVEQQGKGVGGALMRPVLEHCDAEGIPCYLESSKERNVPFYRRHGFEVVEEVPLPGDGPPHLDHVAGAATSAA